MKIIDRFGSFFYRSFIESFSNIFSNNFQILQCEYTMRRSANKRRNGQSLQLRTLRTNHKLLQQKDIHIFVKSLVANIQINIFLFIVAYLIRRTRLKSMREKCPRENCQCLKCPDGKSTWRMSAGKMSTWKMSVQCLPNYELHGTSLIHTYIHTKST